MRVRRVERVGRTDLPPEQRRALQSAIRWEWFTIGYTAVTIVLIALVLGGSQAMRTAWIEDMLSLIPQFAFLIALLFIRRPPTRSFPFGLHRVMGVGHLVAGVALLAVGGILAVESVIGLLRAEHPAIGTVRIWGHTIWLGWFMVAVMSVIVIGPFFYGRAKARLAPVLHNKVLHADADMAKADWTTTAASIVGVLGVGVGLWWLDGVAALFISLGIIWDGYRNARAAVFDLIDQRARTHDDEHEDPVGEKIVRVLRAQTWVRDAGVRMRDMGQVFHVEAFVVPRRRYVSTRRIDALRRTVTALDWRMQDVSIVVVASLPEEARDHP